MHFLGRFTKDTRYIHCNGIHTPWERFIEFYFEIGFKQKDIHSVLVKRHRFHISVRHLKWLLNSRGQTCLKEYSVRTDSPGRNNPELTGVFFTVLHKYRWIYAECRQHGHCLRKESMYMILEKKMSMSDAFSVSSFLLNEMTLLIVEAKLYLIFFFYLHHTLAWFMVTESSGSGWPYLM